MIFNGTLIVQIGNFLITYWLLQNIFLKKGFIIVADENKELEEIQARIALYTQSLHEATRKKEQDWERYKEILFNKKPTLQESALVFVTIKEPILKQQTITTAQITDLAAFLTKKVLYD